MLRDARLRLAVPALAGLLVTACGGWTPKPSVNVKPVPLDLAFGRKVETAAQELEARVASHLGLEEPPQPLVKFAPFKLKEFLVPVEQELACVGPEAGASVEDPPVPVISKANRPEVGDFRTELTGTLAMGGRKDTFSRRQLSPGRSIEGLRLAPSGALTQGINEIFQDFLRERAPTDVPGFDVPGFEYKLLDWGTRHSWQFTVLTPQERPNDNTGGLYRRVMGLYLSQMGFINSKGFDTATIRPATPLKILEFPVVEGALTVRSASYDTIPTFSTQPYPNPLVQELIRLVPKVGDIQGVLVPDPSQPDGSVLMTSETNVVAKDLVFACNELTQGWLVEWTLTISVLHKALEDRPLVGVPCPTKPPPAVDTFMETVRAPDWPLPVGQEGTVLAQVRKAYEQYQAAYEQQRKAAHARLKEQADPAVNQAYAQVPRKYFCQEYVGKFWLATQYGGWPIQDEVHMQGDLANGDLHTRILQVHPSPPRPRG